MINIHIIRDEKKFIWEFTVEGHAYYEEVGKDIICGAVSVIAYNAINALFEISSIKSNYIIRDGYMKCSIPTNIPKEKKYEVKIILETIVIGFKQIENTYGKEYISVLDEEV